MGQVGEWPDELIPLDAHPNPSDRYAAASWARQLLIRRDWVVVDTETTGLTNTDQVLQVAVLDPSGRILVDTTVRPTCEIHPRASEVHGFTIESLGSAPTYDQVHDAIVSHLAGRAPRTTIPGHLPRTGRESCLVQPFPSRTSGHRLQLSI